MRLHVVALLVVVGMLVIAVALPSKRDTSVAAWWTRVCYQLNFFARVALAVAVVGVVLWYVVLPLLGWQLPAAR